MSKFKTIPNPHDALFKVVFSLTSEAKAFLKKFVSESVWKTIDLEQLEPEDATHKDEDLNETFSDVIFKSVYKNTTTPVKISFLFEHKSQGKKLDVNQLRACLKLSDLAKVRKFNFGQGKKHRRCHSIGEYF